MALDSRVPNLEYSVKYDQFNRCNVIATQECMHFHVQISSNFMASSISREIFMSIKH